MLPLLFCTTPIDARRCGLLSTYRPKALAQAAFDIGVGGAAQDQAARWIGISSRKSLPMMHDGAEIITGRLRWSRGA